MLDQSLRWANELVAQTATMSSSDAARYVFDRYRTASAESRDGIVLALVAALSAARQARPAPTLAPEAAA